MSIGLKSSLARAGRRRAGTPEEVGALRRRAFVEHGVAMIHLAQVADPWTKQAVINEARRQLDVAASAAAPETGRRRTHR